MAIQAPAWLIGAVVASLVAASAPVRAEECRYDFATKSFVGDCGGASGIIPPNGNSQNCNQQEAQVAVDWVFTDVGATRTFQRFLADGNSPLDSVIGAQGHNPNAQQALRDCSGWVANYIGTRYAGAIPGLRPTQVDAGSQSCEAPPAGLCYNGCQVSCPAGFAATCAPGITWNDQCWRGPSCECVRP